MGSQDPTKNTPRTSLPSTRRDDCSPAELSDTSGPPNTKLDRDNIGSELSKILPVAGTQQKHASSIVETSPASLPASPTLSQHPLTSAITTTTLAATGSQDTEHTSTPTENSHPSVSPATTAADDRDTPAPSPRTEKVDPLVSVTSFTPQKPWYSRIRWPRAKSFDTSQGPGIYWYTPTTMILLGLIGLLGALGHHLYNDSLSGSPVVNAQWPQRWGVALAFFVKMTLVGSVQMAFKQRAWLTVKKRSFRVKTLDSIFHSCQDPAGFFNKELFTGAFFPALMALLVWILPLSAIASPSTLTATNGLQTSPTTCHNVSTLDFSRENGFGIWRRDPNVNKQGMSFWDEWIRPKTAFYNSPSMDNVRLFRLSMLSNTPLQPPNPCPTDSNCTFAVSFAAPSYKCGKRNDFGGEHRPYNLSQMAPLGDLLYASYSSLDLDEDFVGRPKSWDRSNVTVETGVFKQEPTLWVSWVWNTTLPATSENEAQWDTSYWRTQLKTSIIECTLWNSTYEYTLQFLQGQMNVSDKRVTQDRLLLPAGQVMSPDNPVYMEFAGFHATAFLYRSQLAGNASQKGQDSWVMTESDIFQTEILDPGSGQSPEEDLASRIEAAFHNIYLSFLSNEKQISQVFASRSCEVSSHVLVWHYTPTWLAVSYIIACALTFVAMGVGLHAIVQNGYVAETNFSTFLVTTRNPDLDKMARGSCLGALPVDKEVTKTKLRFGKTVSNEEGGDGDASQATHAAFGFDDRVVELQRGKNYS